MLDSFLNYKRLTGFYSTPFEATRQSISQRVCQQLIYVHKNPLPEHSWLVTFWSFDFLMEIEKHVTGDVGGWEGAQEWKDTSQKCLKQVFWF